ncbi:MAG: hypothetical protein H8K03_21350 [Nitrospira sp.]
MTLRDEIRHFMVVSESLLDGTIKAEDLTYIELELLQYYLCEVGQKFPTHLKLTHTSTQDHADGTSQSLPSGFMPKGE